VAVTVVTPAATAVTSPDDDTLAIPVFALDHVTARPLSVLPFASSSFAESCCVAPSCSDTLFGERLTVATGTGGAAVTVTDVVPLTPPLVAVIVVLPAATPVTNPLADTVATALFPLDQLTVCPFSTAPVESSAVAVSCTVAPTWTDAGFGSTLTLATAAGGGGVGEVIVTVPESLAPPVVALTLNFPFDFPAVYNPEDVMVPPVALHEAVIGLDDPSLHVAMAAYCCVASVMSVTELGDIETLLTVAAGTLMLAVPVFPSLVAVMVAEPAAFAFTTPAALTVATPLFEVDHVTVRPVNVDPFASFNVALSVEVLPI
jgi:hypothetical protein